MLVPWCMPSKHHSSRVWYVTNSQAPSSSKHHSSRLGNKFSMRKILQGKIQQGWPSSGPWWMTQWECGQADIFIYDKLNKGFRDLTSVTLQYILSFQLLNGILFATIIVDWIEQSLQSKSKYLYLIWSYF